MPANYAPDPKMKFTFGLWTVGNIGRDPFGGPTRDPISPVEICDLLGEVGAYGVNFHDNDLVPIRAYAIQKTMRAMDLGAECGAKIYVFWGGREGVESDAMKNPVDSIKRFREAINFLCEYSIEQGYGYKFAFEAKPNEPSGHIYFAVTGSYQ